MRWQVFGLALFMLLAGQSAGNAQDKDQEAADMKRLRGTWQLESATFKGRPDGRVNKTLHLVFAEQSVTLVFEWKGMELRNSSGCSLRVEKDRRIMTTTWKFDWESLDRKGATEVTNIENPYLFDGDTFVMYVHANSRAAKGPQRWPEGPETFLRLQTVGPGVHGDGKAAKTLQEAKNTMTELRFSRVKIDPYPPVEKLGMQLVKVADDVAQKLELPKDKCLLIDKLRADSPAAKAGLKSGDILLEVNGKSIPGDIAVFARMLRDLREPADFTVMRNGKEETIRGLTMPKAEK